MRNSLKAGLQNHRNNCRETNLLPVSHWWILQPNASQTVFPTQANLSQVHNFNGEQYCLATYLAWVGLNLIRLKFSPNSSHVFLWPTLIKLLCYCYVTMQSYSDNWMVSCKLARLADIVWPLANARFDFVAWLELAWVESTVWPGLYSQTL